MPSIIRLDILRELRERAELTQSDMARLCGLHGHQSHQTAGAWERGEIVPNRTRRAKFIGYLWDHLRLKEDPAHFEMVWEVLCDEWHWEPIGDREWAEFTRLARPQRSSLEEQVAYLQQNLAQAQRMAAGGAPTNDSALTTLDTLAQSSDLAENPPEHNGQEHRAYDAILYTQSGNIRKPEILFGRQWLLFHIFAQLEGAQHLLLTGFGGTGKTALAATIADQWLNAGNGSVLWLGADGERLEELLEAMIAPFDAHHELAQRKGDAQIRAVQGILTRAEVRLVVLDNLHQVALLPQLRQCLPDATPMIVTSRYDAAHMDKCIRVTNLESDDLLDLLAHHAQNDRLDLSAYHNDPQSRQLCAMLDNHTLAVVIAGGWLKQNRRPAADLLRRLQTHYLTPLIIELPSTGRQGGQPTVQLLLDQTFGQLGPQSQRLFRTFGALSEPYATSELMTALCNDEPSDHEEPFGPDHFFAVESALDELVAWNFAERDGSNFYRLHDIIHTYARHLYQQQSDPPLPARPLHQALVVYLDHFANDFRNLHLNLPNLLTYIEKSSVDLRLEVLAPMLLAGVFDAYGYRVGFLALLDQAISELERKVKAQGGKSEASRLLHFFLSKRGNGAYNHGDYAAALHAYQAALPLSPNHDREVRLSALVARSTAFYGDLVQARKLFQAAYALADEDEFLTCFVLEQEAMAAGFHHDYATAQRVAAAHVAGMRRLVLTERRVEIRISLVHSLANLGTAMLRLGTAPIGEIIAINQEAVAVAQTLDNPGLQAHALWALGESYHMANEREAAAKTLQEAFTLFSEQGNVRDRQEVHDFMGKHGYF